MNALRKLVPILLGALAGALSSHTIDGSRLQHLREKLHDTCADVQKARQEADQIVSQLHRGPGTHISWPAPSATCAEHGAAPAGGQDAAR